MIKVYQSIALNVARHIWYAGSKNLFTVCRNVIYFINNKNNWNRLCSTLTLLSIWRKIWIITVSYTHLDVYKRQTYTGTNHGNGTWSLPSWIISPSLGTWLQNTILTVTNPYNRSVQYSGSFIVELPSIAPWDICIYAPSALHIWSINGSNTWQSMNIQSEYFTLDDSKWSLSGYYTTLSISDLTSTWSTISKSNIQIKADPITTLSGSTNPAVILDSSILSFTSLSSPVTFIKRNSGTWWGIKGIYWSKINLQVNIPAYQTIGTYTGTLTYTLYEN